MHVQTFYFFTLYLVLGTTVATGQALGMHPNNSHRIAIAGPGPGPWPVRNAAEWLVLPDLAYVRREKKRAAVATSLTWAKTRWGSGFEVVDRV